MQQPTDNTSANSSPPRPESTFERVETDVWGRHSNARATTSIDQETTQTVLSDLDWVHEGQDRVTEIQKMLSNLDWVHEGQDRVTPATGWPQPEPREREKTVFRRNDREKPQAMPTDQDRIREDRGRFGVSSTPSEEQVQATRQNDVHPQHQEQYGGSSGGLGDGRTQSQAIWGQVTRGRGNWAKGLRGQGRRNRGRGSRGGRGGRGDLAQFNTADLGSWPELCLSLSGVPNTVSIRDLYESLKEHGNIVGIDILDPQGFRNGKALVSFAPRPRESFWISGQVPIRASGRVFECAAKVDISRQYGQLRNPAHRESFRLSRSALRPDLMQFGVMIGDEQMMTMNTLFPAKLSSPFEEPSLEIKFEFHNKRFDVFFPVYHKVEGATVMSKYSFRVHFSSIRQFIQTPLQEKGKWDMILSLDYPPRYFRKIDKVESTLVDGCNSWSSGELWHRTCHIVNDSSVFGQLPVSLNIDNDDPAFINLGRWKTFRWVMKTEHNDAEILRTLQDYNIETRRMPGFKLVSFQDSAICKQLSLYQAASLSEARGLVVSGISQLHPEIQYYLESCVSQSVLSEYTLTNDFFKKLFSLGRMQGRNLLGYFLQQKRRVVNPMDMFLDDEAQYFHSEDRRRIPHFCILVQKVIVTPTTIHLNIPTVEADNRVLREYRKHQNRFLRVQFMDELLDTSGTGHLNREQTEEYYARVRRALENGIQIGNRVYEFLAFGNSQLRECGAYFFCPTAQITCDGIRKWMGEFAHIRTVAKYASRVGQCFSSTRAIRAIQTPTVKVIPDILKNGFCFSDGVGRISSVLAEMIVEEMELPCHEIPSAFQFRMGGCKGLLVVSDETDTMEIHVRPSQQKFFSNSTVLEVIRCSQFATATLNRQIIPILTALGVEDRNILNLLYAQLDKYAKAETDRDVAIELLNLVVDQNQITLKLADMVQSDFMRPGFQEPFVRSVMRLWKLWSLKLLKEKARIAVEQSAFLLGCVDETASLEGHLRRNEGYQRESIEPDRLPQIFLQVPDRANPASPDGRSYKVVTGRCIVGRNPSLHPGDIRVVEAVDVPKLRHLRDVVVFPSKGDRDVPGMLSGGDLDGDEYFVIWDANLLPTKWTLAPMDLLPERPTELDRDVQVEDLREFFITYMKSDVLPIVAQAHLANADALQDGVSHPTCLKLAQMHSRAVDFVKSGEPVMMEKNLDPPQWPHFMGRGRRRTYTSQKVLGKIYDKVSWSNFNPDYTGSFDRRILDAWSPDKDTVARARGIKMKYDRAVRRLMNQREITTEFEVWTTFVMSRPRKGSPYKTQEVVGREIAALTERFAKKCEKAAGGSTFDILAPFVGAMYQVTSDEVQMALKGLYDGHAVEMPLISFPWLFPSVMGMMGRGVKRHLYGIWQEKASRRGGGVAEDTEAEGTSSEDGADDGVEKDATQKSKDHSSGKTSEQCDDPDDEVEFLLDYDDVIGTGVCGGRPKEIGTELVEEDLLL